ncbi:MAG: hypothetical protein HY280_02220 [Nitrospinae bacterium]|nr:hypothetical protein [Nitrospinota bacterium]
MLDAFGFEKLKALVLAVEENKILRPHEILQREIWEANASEEQAKEIRELTRIHKAKL